MKNPFKEIRSLRADIEALRAQVQGLTDASSDAPLVASGAPSARSLLGLMDAGTPLTPGELVYCARVAGMGTLPADALDQGTVYTHLKRHLEDHHGQR